MSRILLSIDIELMDGIRNEILHAVNGIVNGRVYLTFLIDQMYRL